MEADIIGTRWSLTLPAHRCSRRCFRVHRKQRHSNSGTTSYSSCGSSSTRAWSRCSRTAGNVLPCAYTLKQAPVQAYPCVLRVEVRFCALLLRGRWEVSGRRTEMHPVPPSSCSTRDWDSDWDYDCDSDGDGVERREQEHKKVRGSQGQIQNERIGFGVGVVTGRR